MKTEISRFCGACADSVAPLPDVLDAAVAEFERRPEALGCSLAILNDLRAHLRSLTDKLKGQQAYLLIFGPLKSGKSTLMNAIAGSYVSEVTSLPGYPCLVFVRNSADVKYSATRYNGRESSFGDKTSMLEVVGEAHHVLAQQIRAAEQRGEDFDPRTTFPEAIRRIDIQVPVPALAESSTVLVDTPGLYSRMNFGYDVLTREFRDSAACAVFVVKTDNLFLEQVFAEFNQLLGIFSRIFIVVNVDTGKRDLAPDGSLRPSAESEHPERVIEAFTTLSMAGPLREAYEAGRVRIHAVDLMGAASSFLSGEGGKGRHRAAFDAFQQDLTEYLNSSDYTREFVRDSLRQARSLCEEARTVANGAEVAVLVEEQAKRTQQIARLDARLAAADRLLGADWAGMFRRFHEENSRNAEDSIRTRASAAREDMRLALARWFKNDESLNALVSLHWNESLANAGRNLFDDIRFQVKRAASSETAGLEVPGSVLADMNTTGFLLAQIGATVSSALTPVFDSTPFPAQVSASTVPVRKTIVDWLFFRSMGKVQTRLFGNDGARDISTQEKDRRFLESSRAALEQQLDGIVNGRFPGIPQKFAVAHSLEYATGAAAEITRRLRELRDSICRERAALQVPCDATATVLAAAVRLEERAEGVASDIELLAMQEGVPFSDDSELPPSDIDVFPPQLPTLVG